jgi:nicotinamide riboside transporter PnuC
VAAHKRAGFAVWVLGNTGFIFAFTLAALGLTQIPRIAAASMAAMYFGYLAFAVIGWFQWTEEHEEEK